MEPTSKQNPKFFDPEENFYKDLKNLENDKKEMEKELKTDKICLEFLKIKDKRYHDPLKIMKETKYC